GFAFAPHIAAKAKPGNFIILRVDEKGERIPLTIADTDQKKGTITIVYLVLGKTTAHLESLKEGDSILDLCGPLGKPTHIEKMGTVICVGGGTGIAAMHHIAKGNHLAGNHVVAIVGARSKDLLLFVDELKSFCPEVLVSTDDGTCGQKGFVTDILRTRLCSEFGISPSEIDSVKTSLQDRLASDKSIAEVVAVGPVPMMRAVAQVVKPFGIKTTVSLNSIMVDGMGMCGACRVTVGGVVKFACVDGPEFDGQLVDFNELASRLGAFKPQEKISYEHFHKGGCCNHG
ncbi:MAG: sulfide/dihydroorotate dehydrogenase-like FAD/NAD-binding protein, partial [Nitrospirota bacterium]